MKVVNRARGIAFDGHKHMIVSEWGSYTATNSLSLNAEGEKIGSYGSDLDQMRYPKMKSTNC